MPATAALGPVRTDEVRIGHPHGNGEWLLVSRDLESEDICIAFHAQ